MATFAVLCFDKPRSLSKIFVTKLQYAFLKPSSFIWLRMLFRTQVMKGVSVLYPLSNTNKPMTLKNIAIYYCERRSTWKERMPGYRRIFVAMPNPEAVLLVLTWDFLTY